MCITRASGPETDITRFRSAGDGQNSGLHIGQAGIVPQPGEGPLTGRSDAAYGQAKALGQASVALTLSSQQFDEQGSLPLRQSRDGSVQAVVLVTAHSVGAWIAFPSPVVPGPVVDQPFHLRLAEQHFPPSLDRQADALPAADSHQPRAEPVGTR